MTDSYKCLCNLYFSHDEMKRHYKSCSKFQEEFRDLDFKFSKAIENFVNKFDSSDNDARINGLLLIKFFLKRYVNLIAKKIVNENGFLLNRAKNNISSNINNSDTLDIQKFKSFGVLNKIQELDVPEKNKQRNNSIYENKKENINSKDNTFNLIEKYCNEVLEKDSKLDEELLTVMSYTISNLTYRKCFICVSGNDSILGLKKSDDDDHKVYCFPSKNKSVYFLVILC